jgi:copper homeostasis protein
MTALEVCLEDVSGAAEAESGGADRIEFCTNLALGGTTPAFDKTAAALETVRSIGVQVLIRQRPGDFVYSTEEVDAMRRDIAAISALAASDGPAVGFVLGALTADGRIDLVAMERLIDACNGATITFHRAFDEIADQDRALEQLIELGMDRVLTSGGAPTAFGGKQQLAHLVRRAGDGISVLAGGGVRARNVVDIVVETGVREVHLRAATSATNQATSQLRVAEIRTLLDSIGTAA